MIFQGSQNINITWRGQALYSGRNLLLWLKGRAVARYENLQGGTLNVVGIICPPLEIGLTDRQKTVGARSPLPTCDSTERLMCLSGIGGDQSPRPHMFQHPPSSQNSPLSSCVLSKVTLKDKWCKDHRLWKPPPAARPFCHFLTISYHFFDYLSFTKLRFTQSFWGAERVCPSIRSIVMTQNSNIFFWAWLFMKW